MSTPGVAAKAGLTAMVAAGAAQVVFGWLQANPPGGKQRWDRPNHAGDSVTLLEGPSLAAGLLAGVAVAPGLPPGLRAGAAVAVVGGAAFGAVDDLAERGKSKGLKGHLGELAHGRLTTGGLKVLGIGASGLVAGALALRSAPQAGLSDSSGSSDAGPGGELLLRVVDTVTAGAVVAGCANLLNLFDLRPGRALKVVLLNAPAALSSPGGVLVGAAGGAAIGLINDDLAGRSMLGDTGANAVGALLGTAVVARSGRGRRLAVLAGIAALTIASEKVSFTRVIAATPGLREFDQLGRTTR
jgi:UDP-GlcNAc:undecaprenyl-phosphate GlcNAc-1-phosphate transferase